MRTLCVIIFLSACASTPADLPSEPNPSAVATALPSASASVIFASLPIASASAPLSSTSPASSPSEDPRRALESGQAPSDVATPPSDAKLLASGVRIKILHKGTGTVRPTDESKVKLHYIGWMRDGKPIESMTERDRPATFKVGTVLLGWRSALPEMVVGDIARIWIPPELAFGEVPKTAQSPFGHVTFDMELLHVE